MLSRHARTNSLDRQLTIIIETSMSELRGEPPSDTSREMSPPELESTVARASPALASTVIAFPPDGRQVEAFASWAAGAHAAPGGAAREPSKRRSAASPPTQGPPPA